MRRQLQLSGFFQRRQGILCKDRLLFKHIRARSSDLSVHQRLIQRIRIHNRTPRHIDQHCALFHFGKSVRIHQVKRFVTQRAVQRQNI